MKHFYLFSVLFTLFNSSFAQLSQGGFPLGLGKESLKDNIGIFVLSPINNEDLLREDELLALQGEKSLRFGKDVLVDISPASHGIWTDLPNGGKLWRLNIKSRGAFNINLIFDRFYLPEGARLFVYAPDGSTILGAYSSLNHNPMYNFATMPIVGEELIIEYEEPANAAFEGQIHLNYIIHGYRDFYLSLKGFNDSGTCNNNVVCPEGEPWIDQIRSSAMLLTSNNNRFCSGAMINNTLNDGKQYLLTADHCGPAATNIFMFNYESPNCSPNVNGPTNQTVQGCIVRARHNSSDFALVELTQAIPANFNVYLSGWSRQTTPPPTSTGIHHPAGDVKKISFNLDATTTATWQGADCWRIPTWEDGTTEGGSSGSPLYNENKQIIGQLFGGAANCSNNVNDYYGRLSRSWSGNNSNSTRLRNWLDPDGSDLASIDGMYLNIPNIQRDILVSGIDAPLGDYCGVEEVIPQIRIRNIGAETVTSCTIFYRVGNNPVQSFNWSGNLQSFQTATVNLPAIVIENEENIAFTAYTSLPNGSADLAPQNDTLSNTFSNRVGKNYTLTIVADNYPEETSWRLRNSANNQILYSLAQGALPDGTTNYTFCLGEGCYQFTIFDQFGDGICCGNQTGNGSYTLRNDLGEIIRTGGQFASSESTNFCIDGDVPTNLNLLAQQLIQVRPNPANELMQLVVPTQLMNKNANYQVFHISGKLVHVGLIVDEVSTLSTSSWSSGIYFIRVMSNDFNMTQKVIVNH